VVAAAAELADEADEKELTANLSDERPQSANKSLNGG
jgi:hypothetical protein